MSEKSLQNMLHVLRMQPDKNISSIIPESRLGNQEKHVKTSDIFKDQSLADFICDQAYQWSFR